MFDPEQVEKFYISENEHPKISQQSVVAASDYEALLALYRKAISCHKEGQKDLRLLKSRKVTVYGDTKTTSNEHEKIDAVIAKAKSGMSDDDRALLGKVEEALHDPSNAEELSKSE